jgi:hypothetical protein
MRGGGIGERRHVLGLLPEMVRKTKLSRGVDDLGDPAARQQVMHCEGGFSAPGLVLRHFSLPNTAFYRESERSSIQSVADAS